MAVGNRLPQSPTRQVNSTFGFENSTPGGGLPRGLFPRLGCWAWLGLGLPEAFGYRVISALKALKEQKVYIYIRQSTIKELFNMAKPTIIYTDENGNRYRQTIAMKDKAKEVKAAPARCLIEDNKLYICWNTEYRPQELGLTRVPGLHRK